MKIQRDTSHDISKHQMVYDGFCILHAGSELATVASYLVDLASYIIYIGMLKILHEY